MKKIAFRRLVAILAAVVFLLAAGAIWYIRDGYPADETAQDALRSDGSVSVSRQEGNWVFTTAEPKAGLVFYPGGKVEAEAYAPLLHELAERGILCVLIQMPCNLAVLDMDAAEDIPGRFPEVSEWYIGGHSLGGAMAANYAAKHTDQLEGVVLLGAYSTADLTSSGLRVVSVYGSEDGVLNRKKYEKNRANLPQEARELVLRGGCHAGFGNYGIQEGDGTPSITAEEQQARTVAAILDWMDE